MFSILQVRAGGVFGKRPVCIQGGMHGSSVQASPSSQADGAPGAQAGGSVVVGGDRVLVVVTVPASEVLVVDVLGVVVLGRCGSSISGSGSIFVTPPARRPPSVTLPMRLPDRTLTSMS